MTVGDGRKFFPAIELLRRSLNSSMPVECDKEKTRRKRSAGSTDYEYSRQRCMNHQQPCRNFQQK
ncbi:hypothetical protein BZK31_19070 [Pseudomonas floridensis]|uniref:Uncharacterized protein n=1 Tax=Pseudomonas floridensis TaxID=1958950 RepID=A0A1X0N2A4_9PSED|nr:hypothetical protein BZK31_19070 [Pseudomonas floridensis]